MSAKTPQDGPGLSIGQYLIQRLQDYGIGDLFGIPGDYVLSFYAQLEKSSINVVGCGTNASSGLSSKGNTSAASK